MTPSDEGTILQRGGEALHLDKLSDRFTLSWVDGRPLSDQDRAEMAQQIGAQAFNTLPNVGLIEIKVAPNQLEPAMARMRDRPDVAFASHVYRLRESPATHVCLTNQLTLQFGDRTPQADIEAIASRFGLERLKSIDGLPQAYVFRVTNQATVNPVKLANRLLQQPAVIAAEPNVVIKAQAFYRPQDPLYAKQWYLQHNGGANLALGSHIAVEQAWDITRGLRSVVVAVIDDAFDLNHPDFQGVGKIVAPLDLKGEDALPQPDTLAENHGTATAGVAIAEENRAGIVGVAPGCALMPMRTTGFLDDDIIERLFDWAVSQGASVISCSWGPSAVYFPLSLRQYAALTRAATTGRNGKGCVIVFAAGNANRPINGTVNERGWVNAVVNGPTRWLNGYTIHPHVIAVSACTSLSKKAAYSNWGNEILVCAPSNNATPGIYLPATGYIPTPPVVRENLQGEGVFTSDRLAGEGYSASDFVDNFGGTSSACPVVAGVAALVLSANPDLTAAEVRQILRDTTDKITDPDPDVQLGRRGGLYNAAGHSEWFGYGKVNAARAVQAAQQQRTVIPSVSRWVQHTQSTAIAIPDFNLQGVTSIIQIAETSLVRDIQVQVQIEHNFLGDLTVYLIAPNGTRILLQNRTLGRATQLEKTYSPDTTPLLYEVLNQSARGQWRLQVVDHAPQDVGRLNRWQLNFGF
jgi:subtilisin family serine protease